MAASDELLTEAEAAITAQGEVGFDLSGLLPILLPIIIEMMSGCMNSRGRATVEERLANPDVWTRIAIRRATRMACRQCGVHPTYAERDAIVAGCIDCGKSGTIAKVLDEVDDNNDWLMI